MSLSLFLTNNKMNDQWYDNILSMSVEELKTKAEERNIPITNDYDKKYLIAALCQYISRTSQPFQDDTEVMGYNTQETDPLKLEQNIEYFKSLENDRNRLLEENANSPKESKIEKWKHLHIEEEPDDSKNCILLKIKFPDGSHKVRRFLKLDTFGKVMDWIQVQLETDLPLNLYLGNHSVPLDITQSFQDLRLSGRQVVMARYV